MAKKKLPVRPEGEITLKQLSDAYLTDLERTKSLGTVSSYKMEMALAMAELGEDLPIASLTPERVAAFNECERVMRTRTGREKAPPTFMKTRRVFRQALEFAGRAKWIDVPADAEAQTVAN